MGDAQVIESLLQDLGGVLGLAAIPCQALLRCAAATLSRFRLFFRVSLRGRNGVLLRVVGALCAGWLPSIGEIGLHMTVRVAGLLRHTLQHFWLSLVNYVWYTCVPALSPILKPSSARLIGIGRVDDDL